MSSEFHSSVNENGSVGVWRTATVLLAAFAVQLPALFYGFDVCDTGFYLTFYENIFSHPDAVAYNFMYYGSGLMGHLLLKLTGGSLLGMRIAGALCNLLGVWAVWAAIGSRERFLPMIMAIVLIGGGNWVFPTSFYNDPMSVMLATCAMSAMIRAFSRPDVRKGETVLLLLLSGFLAGINVFTRLPNILDILFLIPVILCARSRGRHGEQRPGVFGCSLCFLGGWILGVALILMIAGLAGHLVYLFGSYTDLIHAGSSDSVDSSHSMGALVRIYALQWLAIASMAILGALAFRLLLFCGQRHRQRARVRGWIALPLALVAAGMLFLLRNRVEFDYTLFLYAWTLAGLSFAKCLVDDRTLRSASICSLFMILLMPAGSDYGIENAGPIMLWLALPTGLSALLRIAPQKSFGIIRAVLLVMMVIFLIPCINGFIRGRLYFDNMESPFAAVQIGLPETSGIYTSAGRAQRFGTLICAVSDNVPEGETLLVYGSAPMLNYLTHTLPALGSSWPELFTPAQLSRRLNENEPAPYVLMLKFQTLGDEWGSPSNEFMRGANIGADGSDNQENVFHNRRKSELMLQYLERRGYSKQSEGEDYILYKR